MAGFKVSAHLQVASSNAGLDELSTHSTYAAKSKITSFVVRP